MRTGWIKDEMNCLYANGGSAQAKSEKPGLRQLLINEDSNESSEAVLEFSAIRLFSGQKFAQ